jgi:hypothetical protein
VKSIRKAFSPFLYTWRLGALARKKSLLKTSFLCALGASAVK